MKNFIYLILIFLAMIFFSCTKQMNSVKITGDYLGESPTDSAAVFAEGIISKKYNERDLTISPDGNEIYFSIKGPAVYSIITLKRINEIWSEPKVASFSGNYSDLEPAISPDGSKLFFVSNRPIKDGAGPKDFDIWYSERTDSGWSVPINPGLPLNTEANEFYPSITKNGKVYFCVRNKMTIGGEDIFYSQFGNGKFSNPVNLDDPINTRRDEFNAFISPNDDYLIYTTTGYGDGEGGGDLWISFKDNNEIWSSPKNLGGKINSSFLEFCPGISPDGKYLFFTSNRGNQNKFSEIKLKYQQIVKDLNSTLNGNHNIYWIKADFLENMK